ncbi:MAG: response regulator [Candidatus Aenigmarchaeota archaeon]|nr:response regulator [Candidatus Aenigmarchaeota archaeon]
MSSKKLMVVDDEESIRELVKAIFENEGFKVIVASSGLECLEELKKERPDLILLDMMMPKMSGRVTLEKIRADPKTKDIKVAFLTVARFSEVGLESLKKMNISDYITKPFDNDELLKRVKKILE